ncbi:hypothetical protein DL769_000149 [Monosporascus sp. CRB-8-3]|nr:hypothetical protein DL769_000149 [Monosporascus sp. CRB-8-3]
MAPHINKTMDDSSGQHSHINSAVVPDTNGTFGSQRNGVDSAVTSQAAGLGPGASAVTPIAVCGMALRLPGGLASPQQLWDFLLAKGDARVRVPESRYNVSAYHSKSGRPGTVATEYGYFLDESVKLGALDTSRFSFSRAELESADPQQRLMLEVVRECLDDAGEVGFRGRSIGCYMGCYGEDWLEIQSRDPQQSGPSKVDGYNDFMLSNRVSYEMDLRGPSMTVRTACSSALVGLHESCLAIQRGDCEAAVVGGANLIFAPGLTTFMTEKGVLSPEGSCKTFSANADGYARGEAISAVYIKPLDAAVRDGNPIRAVIRATMTNSDGKTQGISVPSATSQEAMIRKAYEVAGITDFSKTAFVECHGTGTPIGDPLEAKAIASVLGGDAGVFIGSVKPNLGHSEGASGITSLIKAVLSLENQTIPPNIKFSRPNPKIPFHERNLRVPLESTPWPEARHERVSINSFGLGGTNAHVVLDSARSFQIQRTAANGHAAAAVPGSVPGAARTPSGTGPQLLLFSANSASSLQRMTQTFQDWVGNKHNEPRSSDYLQHLAYTLANRREHLPHRSFMVASRDQPGMASPGRRASDVRPDLVMVFTGQGAQWPRMGRELLLRSDLCFQTSIRSLDQHLREAHMPATPRWTLEEELLKPAKISGMQTAELSQPLCTAVQIGLIDLFAAAGIEPDAVVGHSSGEIAAAYGAGALTAKEAIIAAWQRGLAAAKQTRLGAMAAIGLSWDDVRGFLSPKVVVACENSPKSVTLSGDAAEVEEVVSSIKKAHPHALARLLKVDKAYHSYHMCEIGEEYCAMVRPQLQGKPPLKPFFSSVTGKLHEAVLDAAYWQKNLESPVLFSSAVSTILDHMDNVAFLEIGPHPALAGPVRQILTEASSSAPYVSAMTRGKDCVESFLSAVGTLFELNMPVNFNALMPPGRCLPGLPTYPWDHDADYWRESRMAYEWRCREFPNHPLLGIRQLESTSLEPSWRKLLHVDKDASWLRDHKIEDNTIFPCAGYLAMVGEGIRQVSGRQDGFTLRDVVIAAALVLAEGRPTELVTTFRPHRLTDSLDSPWWDFTIASHNGHMWIKHCTGQVTSAKDTSRRAQTQTGDLTQLPRKMDQLRFYRIMGDAGLQFGPRFQRLRDLRTGTMECLATAEISSVMIGDEEHYHLHPTIVDACLQSAALAAMKGRIEAKEYRRVPTKIDWLSMYYCDPNVNMSVSTSATYVKGSRDVVGQVQEILAEGKVVFHMEGLKLSPLEEAETPEPDGLSATARLTWGPHIDFLDAANLIRPSIPRHLYTQAMNELTRLCIVYSHRHIQGVQPTLRHMQKYQTWIQDQEQAIGTGPYSATIALCDQDIMDKVSSLVQQLSDTPMVGCAVAMQKVVTNISGLLSGQTEALDILLAGDTLTKLYIATDACDRSDFIRHLSHTKPNLRILEIGAGTGASTSSMLKYLTLPGPRGQALFSKYTFTDISSAFFVAAKDLFKRIPNMEYRTLDISKSPAEQGFDGEKYDLVIATNVIHATRSLGESLRNVHMLLAPGGRLLLHELFSPSKWPNFVFGILPGWWYGESDGRPDEPFVSPARWESELISAGFAGLDAVALDAEEPHQVNAIMVARAQTESMPSNKGEKTVTLLCDHGGQVDIADALSRQLHIRGYAVQRCQLGDKLPPSQDVISLLDSERPFLADIDEARYQAFQGLMNNLNGTGMLWVTHPCQVRCRDPRYAQIIGAARAIRNEMLVDLATCEVDCISSSVDRIIDVFAQFQARGEDGSLKPDMEYAIVDGTVHVGRICPISLKDEVAEDDLDHVHLEMAKPGRLTSLRWSPRASRPLSGDEIEVQVYAAGLNFRDVLCALGIVAFPEEGLGLEASGIVCRVGPQVKDLVSGDRVMFLGKGAFSTHTVIRERYCERIPGSLSFEDSAAMPIIFATAAASLFKIGGLQKGQSVLIHSACGGVGLAAIQLARMVGAEIYTTVGSEEKVRYLTDTIGLPAYRIFSSRDTTFVDGLMRETLGRGVDLVLNSLSGELLHATWRCVAEFGTMVEIGKRDLLGKGRLDMDVFLPCRTYSCFDLDEFNAKKPEACKELLRSVMGYFEKGHITPIRPIKAFDASSIEAAFRYMQKGQHMGKIVISMRGADGGVKVDTPALIKPLKELELDSSASYLLVGGFGGLGHSVARYLVEHNARRLVFLSRSGGAGQEDIDLVRELESMGCDVRVVKGSVASADDVARAVQQAGPALKGIMQLSMVLRDEAFPRMRLDDWDAAVAPKVRGTWLLHEAALAAGIDLDFFVLFSSLSGVLGQPGQVNYSGANTFLDAFVQYRIGLGLPAASVDIGVVKDIGAVSVDKGVMQRMKQAKLHMVTELELLETLSAAITIKGPHSAGLTIQGGTAASGTTGFVEKHTLMIGIGTTIPLSHPENRAFFRKDRRLAIYHNTTGFSSSKGYRGSSNADGLRALIARVRSTATAEEGGARTILRADETAAFLAREIGRKLFTFLLRNNEDLDACMSVPLSQLGMDSLVGVEMRNWWRQAFGFDITVLELLGMGNLDLLGKHAAEGLERVLI